LDDNGRRLGLCQNVTAEQQHCYAAAAAAAAAAEVVLDDDDYCEEEGETNEGKKLLLLLLELPSLGVELELLLCSTTPTSTACAHRTSNCSPRA
jgi:hypothetical protein